MEEAGPISRRLLSAIASVALFAGTPSLPAAALSESPQRAALATADETESSVEGGRSDIDLYGDAPLSSAPQTDIAVHYDLSKLPAPVQRMRELIVDAAKTGDIEALRPLLGTGITRTRISIGGDEGDPIDYLKAMSGDGEGQELLAILLDVLEAGYVHLDAGEPTEIYLWPYFYALPFDSLDGRQRVELFRIITAGDYMDMEAYGGYIFYRAGIGPQGDWKFFVAGD